MGIPSYGVDYEGQYDFLQIGTITFAEAALGVDERDNASVEDLAVAKKVIWRPDQGTAAAILRFRTDGSEDDAPVIEMYGAKGADYYTRIGTLTLAQGTQDWSGGHFVDEITLSNEAWAHGIRANSVTDEVGRVVFNTGGFDRFLFIASTLAVTTVHIDIARLDKQIDHGLEIHSAILVLADNMTVSDVVSAISDMHSDLAAGNDGLSAQNSSMLTQLTAIHGKVNITNNTLAGTIEASLDSIETDMESAVVGLTNLYGLLGVNNDLTDLSRMELDSINDVLSNALVQLVAIQGKVNITNQTLAGTIENSLDSIETDMEAAVTQLTAIQGKVNITNNTLAGTIEASLDSIETDMEAAVTQLTGLYGLTNINNDLTDLSRMELDSINDVLSNALVQLVAIQGKVNITNNTLGGTIHNDLDSIETDVEAAVTQLTGLYGLANINNNLTDLMRSNISDTLVTAVTNVDAAVDDVESAITSCLTQLTGLYGLLNQNNQLTDLSRMELDSINDVLSNALVQLVAIQGKVNITNNTLGGTIHNDLGSCLTQLTGLYGLLNQNNQLTDLSRVELDSINDGISNAVVQLTGLYGLLNQNNNLTDLSRLQLVAANGSLDSIESAMTQIATDGVDLSDIVSANLATKGAVDLVTTEVSTAVSNLKTELSDAISNLKDEVTAQGDIGLISGPETVTVTSNTQTLSELGIALDTDIRRVTLIPDTSGIYWADGAAVYGTNPFPNAVTQIDCTKAQIITREFVVSDGTTQDMQVIQEG